MNIATIGTGSIVELFLSAVEEVDGTQCVAVYSRKEESAERLADKFDIAAIYTDMNEMMENTAIDFVYIASPNSLHFEHAHLALKNGKNVICEKPFTSTVREAEQLAELAKEKQLMIFEAISTIHMPNYKLISKHLESLGPIKMVQCNYSQFSSRYEKLMNGETPNVFNPEFSGGALADINIYNLHFVLNLFGRPEQISYTANKHPNGIDTSGIAVMKYPNFIAECVGAKDSQSMNFAMIQGEKGYLNVLNGANGCQEIIISIGDREIRLNAQTKTNRLYYEVAEFQKIYQEKDYERCYALLDYTQSVMEVLVAARIDGGVVFPADESNQ
ncbi:Gfo/Idh/MocA family protein [Oceanobacillus saliphilus]|uniref:Gfo/Idh/MocA family protein n=1 Tax=Oceanobacillus saliphilus TaxID=2925834 RepID=UPI00201D65A0|nr:Gfo/Idh/MocA family oxidoreductase [Oceanobacillus saliphilus]